MRTVQTLLAYEAKKKPIIAEMIARWDTISDHEIETAPVLPWIKKAIREVIAGEQYKKRIENADISAVVHGFVPDPIGKIYRWDQDTSWVKDRHTHIEIKNGDLIWFHENIVWIKTVRIINPETSLILGSRFVREASRLDCIAAYKERISRLPISDIIDISPPLTPMGRLAGLGVRFS